MIRLANKKDLIGIMKCINDAKYLFKSEGSDQWQDTDNYPNENTILNDINRNELYVYIKENEVLGCIVLSSLKEECYEYITDGKWLNNDDYLVIHRLAVRGDSYQKGIAWSLIEFCIKESICKHVKSIKVDTKRENNKMLNLLSKCGFKQRGIIYLLRADVLDKERIALEFML